MLILRSGSAILDGRTAPVVLDTTYTFTDYEWARGEVYFNAGFVIPKNTTAIWGVDVPFKGYASFSSGATSISELSTIILEKPLINSTGLSWGSCMFKTLNDYEGIVSGFSDFGDRFAISGNVTIDFGYISVYFYIANTSGPYLQPGFALLDTTVASTLRLRNGNFVECVDFNRGYPGSLFSGSSTIGRHKLYLENMNINYGGMGTDLNTMTFDENIDLIIDNGTTSFYGPRTGRVNCNGTLKINDFGILQAGPGFNFNIQSALPGLNYFDIAPHGKLLLANNTLTFTCPLRIPCALGSEDSYARILVDGKSTLRGINSDGLVPLQLGVGPQLTYTYDAMIDIAPFSTLTFDNVAFTNKNVIF